MGENLGFWQRLKKALFPFDYRLRQKQTQHGCSTAVEKALQLLMVTDLASRPQCVRLSESHFTKVLAVEKRGHSRELFIIKLILLH